MTYEEDDRSLLFLPRLRDWTYEMQEAAFRRAYAKAKIF